MDTSEEEIKLWSPTQRRVKTPTVLQMEAVECGAAALNIIFGFHKLFIPLEEARVECGVTRDGSKAINMVKVARKYGFIAKGIRASLDDLNKIKLPYIVFWNFNHFLVVEGFGKDIVYLNDPATGPRTVTFDEFDKSFTGVTLTLTPGPEFKKTGRKSSILISLGKRLKGKFSVVIYSIIVGLALVIPGILTPIFTKIFVDNYLIAHMDSWLRPLLIGMFITAIGRSLLTWIQKYYLLKFETKLDLVGSGQFFWQILRLPIEFFGQRSVGDISSRIILNNKVARVLARKLATAALDMMIVVFYLMLMFYYSPSLTLISMLIAGVNFIMLRKVSRVRRDKSIKLSLVEGNLFGTALNGLSIIETLKASGRENDFFNKIAGVHAKFTNAVQELKSESSWVGLLPVLLNALNNTVILGLGGLYVIQGNLTVGMLVAFQSMAFGFIGPINNLIDISASLQDLNGDMNKIDDVMKYRIINGISQHDETDAEVKLKKSHVELSGALDLKNLTFGYSPHEPPLINGFSLNIKPGGRVAIIGPSGSGKSTVTKLVSRLYYPWDGIIKMDGVLIEQIPFSVLYSMLAVVDQEISMFRGTIRENLTMWDETISEEDIVQAAKDACIHEDIVQRESGYDSEVIESGYNFSGGQRQRLEIARALAKNPRILLLDEATSALDPLTEKIIDGNIRRRGCTTIIVAHRLSTIRDCDEILVLEKGIVVQRGTHDELKMQEGRYANLIKTVE